MEGAYPSYIMLQKEEGAVRIRIHFSSARRNGSAAFDARGALTSTQGYGW